MLLLLYKGELHEEHIHTHITILIVLFLCTGFASLILVQYLSATNHSCESQAHAILQIPADNLAVYDPTTGFKTGTTHTEASANVGMNYWQFGGAVSYSVYDFVQEESGIENNNTEYSFRTSANSDSYSWLWTQGFSFVSSTASGQYTPVALNVWINGINQQGQERWLWQEASLFAGLVTSHPGDLSFAYVRGYAVNMNAKCQRNVDGTYTTRYFGFYYSNNEEEEYDSNEPFDFPANRIFTIPPASSSLDDSVVYANTVGYENCLGRAQALLRTRTAKINQGGGGNEGGGGPPIVP